MTTKIVASTVINATKQYRAISGACAKKVTCHDGSKMWAVSVKIGSKDGKVATCTEFLDETADKAAEILQGKLAELAATQGKFEMKVGTASISESEDGKCRYFAFNGRFSL